MFKKIIFLFGIVFLAILFLVAVRYVFMLFKWIRYQGWKVRSWNASNDPDYHAFGTVYYKIGKNYPSGYPKYYRDYEDALMDKDPIDG